MATKTNEDAILADYLTRCIARIDTNAYYLVQDQKAEHTDERAALLRQLGEKRKMLQNVLMMAKPDSYTITAAQARLVVHDVYNSPAPFLQACQRTVHPMPGLHNWGQPGPSYDIAERPQGDAGCDDLPV